MSFKECTSGKDGAHNLHQCRYCPTAHRFLACLSVVCTMGVLSLAIGFWKSALGPAIWMGLYSKSLTRQKRACFNEQNVLDTYQPRNRTMGHLFQPDPPTPVPGGLISEGEKHENTNESDFNKMRDAHYAGEFTVLSRLNKAMDEKQIPKGSESPIVEEAQVSVEFEAPPEDEDDVDSDWE